MTAIQLIEKEREKQIRKGFTLEHDDAHTDAEILWAANCYCYLAASDATEYPKGNPPGGWPWEIDAWNPEDDITNLVKSAALIVAEIERLQRLPHD